MAEPKAWRGRLFLDAGMILYVGPGALADHHAHHAVQLVWAIDGTITVTLAKPLRRQAVLIPASEPHALDAAGTVIALLLVESHGARGVALDRRARRDLGVEVVPDLSSIEFPTEDLAPLEVSRWCDAVLAALGAAANGTALSSLSRRAVAYIEAAIDGMPRLTEAAKQFGVSPTQLTHVFSREVGIPFRRFVLWTRIKHAVAATHEGADLTRAAVAAGFSDAAHFSRTFRAMFGLSPSLVLPIAETVGTLWGPAP